MEGVWELRMGQAQSLLGSRGSGGNQPVQGRPRVGLRDAAWDQEGTCAL